MKTFNLGDKVFYFDDKEIIQGKIVQILDDNIYHLEYERNECFRVHWFDLYSNIWDVLQIIDDKIDDLTSQKNHWKERIHCESCHNVNRPREFEPCKSCENYENWRP